MSITRKAAAVATALSLAGAASAAIVLSTGAANAATPPCGARCYDIFSKRFGSHGQPSFVLSVASRQASV